MPKYTNLFLGGPSNRAPLAEPVETRHSYRLKSRANERIHWRPRMKLNRSERQLGYVLMCTMLGFQRPAMPLRITLTRIAPRKLDREENLPMAWKSLKDGICDYLGIDDRREDMEWVYVQAKDPAPRTYAICIRVEGVAL